MKLLNQTNPSQPAIALLPWGHVWEDFLDTIGVSLETFCRQGPGGWMLGYMHALHAAGLRTVLILISARVTEPLRFKHDSTGATISVLPAPNSYRAIRSQMIDPYPSFGGSVEKLFGDVRGSRRLLLKVFKEVAPYLTTPSKLLIQELQREGCIAILCQEYEYFRFDSCVLLGQLLHLPVFATFQGNIYDENLIGRFLRPKAIKASAGLIIGSQVEIQRVYRCYHVASSKIAKIFNPIDLSAWNPVARYESRMLLNLPIDAQIVVWHGRVEIEIKGLDVLLDAWEQVCRQQTNRKLQLMLMGTGKDAEQLRQHIAALPTNNVLWVDEYVNNRTAIQRFLSAGDVYAFPSRHEGFPVAPIEAMACGLPVVAAAAPGVADILEGGEVSGGLIVPCGDAVAFAAALNRILNDETWCQEMGKRARCRVEDSLSLEVVSRQLRGFFLRSGLKIPEKA
ncbi:MAG: glycosyltransferase family 4 protein [Chroococcidiopsidaceae cyanobacterium CP_BM_RX_35]|nr:glycosyltransferase family 4 protein [Chroococcidiopsidaceae cyanobacterium CP_BM_RX_35]